MADRKLNKFLKGFKPDIGRAELRGFLKAARSGITLRGSLQGSQEAIAKLQGLNRSVQKRMIRKGIRKAAQLGAKISKNYAPSNTRTLRNSLGWRVARMRPGVPTAVGIIGPRRRFVRITSKGFQVPTKYAHLVDQGTRAHIINAKKNRLFFRVGGRSVFVKYVRHPGARATHFLRRGEQASHSPMHHAFTTTLRGELAREAVKARPSEVDDG